MTQIRTKATVNYRKFFMGYLTLFAVTGFILGISWPWR